VEDLLTGVSMVARQLEDILVRNSVQPIEALGQPFDPNLHEALGQMPSTDYPAMTVMQELERGYTLHDRVVRPSKVMISSGPPEPAAIEAKTPSEE
jgi:molecular chaperone GrpE